MNLRIDFRSPPKAKPSSGDHPEGARTMLNRMALLLGIMITILVIFIVKLIWLQIDQVERFRQASLQNSVKHISITPMRGRILARDGTVLAENRNAVDLMYRGGEVRHWLRIKHLLDIEGELEAPDLSDTREAQVGRVLKWNVERQYLPTIEELAIDQPKVDNPRSPFHNEASIYLRRRIERTYPTKLAPHVVGYTTEADPVRFTDTPLEAYELGLVGLKGIEASYQAELHGIAGRQVVERNSYGEITRTFDELYLPSVPGQDITLTIDPQLQKAAEKTLSRALKYVNQQRDLKRLPYQTTLRGALIALNPKNGEILAMASVPSYDPNLFTQRPSDPQEMDGVLNDSYKPLLNRAVQAYPPASTFKLISSLALLEGGYITPLTEYLCSGYYYFLGITMRNWAGYSKGSYNVSEAIADSCNTFYFAAAANTPNARTGWGPFAEFLTDYAQEIGYGAPLGIGLDEEQTGLVPNDDYSRRVKGYPWRPGDTLNISIGQGDMLATPVQVATLGMTLAMNGKQSQPHLVKALGDQAVKVPVKQVSGNAWATVRGGMRLMTTTYGGRFVLGPGVFPKDVAGKTGTAQNADSFLLGAGYEHGWFMAYGDIADPEIVACVLIENAGSSTAVAVPILRDFFALYWGIPLEDVAD